VNSADLVARVQGFVQEILYEDGALVKKGTPLFVIEPEPYRLKLQQAQAAEAGSQAALTRAEAEFARQEQLRTKDVSTQANYDRALADRDSGKANLQEAQSNTKQAAINLGYTQVAAPFDGIVTARQVSVGQLVGTTSPTTLASIVQLDPIYVNFNISEQDVLRIRAEMARRGITRADLKHVPVEVGLQTESGYPHKGTLDYIAPSVNSTTGTLAVRGVFQNADRALLPGFFVRVRVPVQQQDKALLVPDVALGSDQGGRYVLVVDKDDVVAQRKVELGPIVGDLRVIEKGLQPDDRVVVTGILHAIPGQKVEPQMQASAAGTEAANAAK
jgi:RND family efflux transporter MFP subunit